MRKFKLLLFMFLTVPVFGQAPTISPVNPAVNSGSATQQFTCTANCGTPTSGWTCSSCAGSINSGTGLYAGPASTTAKNQLGGYQLLPNNHIFNVDISALSASAISSASGNFNIVPAFPVNYCNASTPTDNMVFYYTPGNNGTFCAPSQNGGLSGVIESGWYQARTTFPMVSGEADHHYFKINYVTGIAEEQYQYYPVGNGTAGESCPLCNSQSGVRYSMNSYAAPASGLSTDASGLYIMPLMLRRQEFATACANGAGTGSINHALRLTFPSGYISNAFIWPAGSVAAGGGTHDYGERYRLKSSFNQSGYSACAQLILTALKHYGLFLTDIGFNWQANIEYAPWSETEVGYFAEINSGSIPDTQFEKVDESSLEISVSSWEANTGRETVCYTASTGTTCTDVVLLGVTVGMTQDVLDIMAGSPSQQLSVVVKGHTNTAVTWTLSSATGSINSSSGLYTPPSTLATQSTITATATSSADSAVASSMLLRIWPQTIAYVLPGFTTGHDFTDSGGKSWRSGAGIGIQSQQAQIGCCADYSGSYTGSATDNELWDHAFTGSLTNLADNHIYWIVPAGTYTVTFHTIARDALSANTSNVNFIAQSSTKASNVDFAASGVGQYGPYTRSDSISVGCDNLLTYDIQMYDHNGFNAISSFSIAQNTSTQSSCGQSSASDDGPVIVF